MSGSALGRPRAGADEERVFDEVRGDFKGAPRIGNGRGGLPARRDIQGNVPPVVEKRGEFHAHFAYDLRPQVQRLAGVPPRLVRQGEPALPSLRSLCPASAFHGLFALLLVPLAAYPEGCCAVRFASWSASSKASRSQEPGYKTPLMKKVGLPCTPLCSPLSTSSSMRANPHCSAMSRAYCCRSRPTASAKRARSASSRVC